MYTSLGSGDILVRMCGSWEKMYHDAGVLHTNVSIFDSNIDVDGHSDSDCGIPVEKNGASLCILVFRRGAQETFRLDFPASIAKSTAPKSALANASK